MLATRRTYGGGSFRSTTTAPYSFDIRSRVFDQYKLGMKVSRNEALGHGKDTSLLDFYDCTSSRRANELDQICNQLMDARQADSIIVADPDSTNTSMAFQAHEIMLLSTG